MWWEFACPDNHHPKSTILKKTYLCAPCELLKKCMSVMFYNLQTYCWNKHTFRNIVLTAWSAFLDLFTWPWCTTCTKALWLFFILKKLSTNRWGCKWWHTTLGARGFIREELQSGEKRRRDRGKKTSGCPWQLLCCYWLLVNRFSWHLL